MTAAPNEGHNGQEFEAVLEYLKHSRGFDFTGYKRASLQRRASKRLQQLKLEHYADYLDYLEVHPEEFVQLFNTILINVTAFFRDAAAWDYFSQHILPEIVATKKAGEPIRVWSAGCASGEEAYTLVMVLAEILGPEAFRQRVKIYATDVDEEALMQARQASYSARDMQPVAAALRDKYFEAVGNHYIFRPDLRRAVIFGRHDLVQDAPISFQDVTRYRHLRTDLEKNQQELETAYEELQSTNEELETANEELQSTVEELETTNEELQSTNEELETMNEELQSSNEELQTMNDELRQRTDELNLANAFLESMLASLHAGAIAIDCNFTILMWNHEASALWGLRAAEVRGQSLLSLDIGLPVDQLQAPVRTLLNGGSTSEEFELAATNRRGKTIQCRITCSPLLGTEQDIQGVLLLMEEWERGPNA